MLIISIILFILGLISIYFSYTKWKNYITINKDIENQNQIILENNKNLLKEKDNYIQQINEYKEITNNLSLSAKKSFENYCDLLDKEYSSKEEEYQMLVDRLYQTYNEEQDILLEDLDSSKQKLDKLKKTYAAAKEAQLKEEEIKKQKEFYSLSIQENDLKDAKVLKEIEYKLVNPRILRMLIWKTYYQQPMTQLCNNVLGTGIVCGIYKITNQLNDMVYIGQAQDVSKRWKDHAKCGLGIDTPVSNKLYTAMIKDGLENFTFELLEKCTNTELNSKEKFYIELYQADKYGYNSKAGNNT